MQNRLLRLFRFLLACLPVLAEVGSILGRQYIPKFSAKFTPIAVQKRFNRSNRLFIACRP